MKIAFLTLGCKLNYAETSTYERGFIAAGMEVVPWREKADIYLVNTCSVTSMADTKSRNLIRKTHRVNPDARILVTGCSAQLRRSDIEKIEGVWRVFGCQEKSEVVPWTLKALATPAAVSVPVNAAAVSVPVNAASVPVPVNAAAVPVPVNAAAVPVPVNDTAPNVAASPTVPASGGAAPAPPSGGADAIPQASIFAAYSTGERTRSFLKVQDGCNNYCAYCTVPYARGESRNIPIAACVENARAIAAQGVKEIVLTGVNTGDFGRTTGERFPDLLRALDAVEGIERYRISSIEPNLLTDEIIGWIASGTKFQPHFHIPLQTGSDELLQRMGRHYDTAFFASRIDSIRRAMEGPGRPAVFFGIDVMVGLPGETPEMFAQTRRFIESIRPAFIHVFPYSRRPGTPAARMPGQVDGRQKAERVASLEALCSTLHAGFVESCRGKKARVLFESTCRAGMMEGYTENYIRVERPFCPEMVGRIVEVTV